MGSVGRIVQYHEDTFAGHQAPVQAGLGIQRDRDTIRRDCEGVEEAANGLGRRRRPTG
jgi:hypothetical protein